MPTDPRLAYRFDEAGANFISVPDDSTINAPTMGAGGYVPSTSLGLAVTLVNTGTNTPQIGLGSAGNELFGKIKQVELDGTVSVQHRGFMNLPYVTGGSQPTVGNPVGVDGTGKVQLQAGNKQAFCVGFVTDPASGNTVCVVYKV